MLTCDRKIVENELGWGPKISSAYSAGHTAGKKDEVDDVPDRGPELARDQDFSAAFLQGYDHGRGIKRKEPVMFGPGNRFAVKEDANDDVDDVTMGLKGAISSMETAESLLVDAQRYADNHTDTMASVVDPLRNAVLKLLDAESEMVDAMTAWNKAVGK